MNWQPIETAPKDGSQVLLWLPLGSGGQVMIGKWITPYFNGDIDRTSPPRWDVDTEGGKFTHWMPLPEPPNE